MQQYYFEFGYATPDMVAANKRLRADMEDSMAFFIIADSREQAFTWGQRLADAYIQAIYRDSAVTLEGLGYAPGRIVEGGPKAYWSQRDLGTWSPEDDAAIAAIPVVRDGAMPDVAALVAQRYDANNRTTDE